MCCKDTLSMTCLTVKIFPGIRSADTQIQSFLIYGLIRGIASPSLERQLSVRGDGPDVLRQPACVPEFTRRECSLLMGRNFSGHEELLSYTAASESHSRLENKLFRANHASAACLLGLIGDQDCSVPRFRDSTCLRNSAISPRSD